MTVTIRQPVGFEMDQCGALVRDNWGEESYQRFYDQYVSYLSGFGDEYAPQFYAATMELDKIVGFAAMRKSMLMNGFWEFIWVAVHPDHQGKGIGDMLTNYRLDRARELGATSVLLVTQKPKYFNRFGFITDREHGNGWHAMSAQLKPADMK